MPVVGEPASDADADALPPRVDEDDTEAGGTDLEHSRPGTIAAE
jgi:hypothetical protein